MSRPLAILITVVAALLFSPSGAHGGAICVGGSEHLHTSGEQCASPHALHAPGSVFHDAEHDHCHCVDVPLTGPAVFPTRGTDDDLVPQGTHSDGPHLKAVFPESRTGSTGPPRAPPWHHPATARRLALIASIRLVI